MEISRRSFIHFVSAIYSIKSTLHFRESGHNAWIESASHRRVALAVSPTTVLYHSIFMLISLRVSRGTDTLPTEVLSEDGSVLPTASIWKNQTAVCSNVEPSTTTVKQWAFMTTTSVTTQPTVTTKMVTITKFLARSSTPKFNCTTTLLWQPQRIAGKTTTVYKTTTTITSQFNCKGCNLVTKTLPYTVPVSTSLLSNASPTKSILLGA